MSTSLNLKRFIENNARIDDRISITKSYAIGLTTLFCQQNNISNFHYVVLFYDSEKKIVALHFTNNDKEPGVLKVSHDNKGRGAVISATSFLKANRIDPARHHGKYNWVKYPNFEGIGDIFVFEIKETASEVS